MVYKRTRKNQYGITFTISSKGIKILDENSIIEFNNHEELRNKLNVVFIEQVSKKIISEYLKTKNKLEWTL